MPPLAPSEVRAVVAALTDLYVAGDNHGHWHVYTFALLDGRTIRGRVVELHDDVVVVALDESGHSHINILLDEVAKLQVEAE